MYGKHFSCTYTGSMVGMGVHIFAVWGYIIAHTIKGYVKLNPIILAATLGTNVDTINKAIDYLCQPDPNSRNKEYEGRRLIKEGEYQYSVTGYSKYHNILNEDERREYFRAAKQRERSRKRSTLSAEAETIGEDI